MKTDAIAILFCDVIDNYGDAGFCVRLGKALIEHGKKVIIFTNKPSIFYKIIGEANILSTSKENKAIQIFEKEKQLYQVPSSQDYIIFDLFQSRAPIKFLRYFRDRSNVSRVVLDYLSTENWSEKLQGILAPDPPLLQCTDKKLIKLRDRYWYSPGLSKNSGGLITENRESIDEKKRNSVRNSILSLEETRVFGSSSSPTFFICDFSYEKFRYSFLSNFVDDRTFVVWSPRKVTLSQYEFDLILQSMDLNIIRGEDSFVTAHFASASNWKVPFFWQPYLELNGGHENKFSGWKSHFKHLRLDSYWKFAEALQGRKHEKYCDLWSNFQADWLKLKSSMSLDCIDITKRRSLLTTLLNVNN